MNGAASRIDSYYAYDAAQSARDVVALLEVLWERGRDGASPAPVSTPQLRVLHVLERGEGINLNALCKALGAAPSSASRLCDRLQALGLIESVRSEANRRERYLRLTGEGAAYLAGLRVRREEALLDAIDAMPPTARRALAEGLRGFRRAVRTTAPELDGAPSPRPSRRD
ncbi:MarR family transcriptional regulator [Streptomyces sp. RS10V-4]|nr:MarR family transcriptional regulator [Streptomyces rhizoryzae]MCK7624447.1 MarR family transcriptional regulator [Streptomyces rhizoryzae]